MGDLVGIAGGLHGAVEGDAVGIFLRPPAIEHRRQVGAAAEPLLGRVAGPRENVCSVSGA